MAGYAGEVLRRVLPVSSFEGVPFVGVRPQGKTVVVTGADPGGLGSALVVRLVALGFSVHAGVFTADGAAGLRALVPESALSPSEGQGQRKDQHKGQLCTFPLDVTDLESVRAASSSIAGPLFALVNCAQDGAGAHRVGSRCFGAA